MFRLILRGSVCLALLAFIVGCTPTSDVDRPATVPVSGTVTYNGAAVDGATVTFSPASGGFGSIGTTDAQGKFTLMSQWRAAGAVPGSYKVTISKSEVQSGEEGEPEEARPGEDAGEATVTELLPEKYKSAKTSELTAEVKAEGENNFPFDLTD